MTKSGSTPRKPRAPQQANSSGVVTRFGNRRRNPDGEPARFQARLDPHTEELLKALEEHIEQLPDMNATRVVQLHQRIQSGDYQIDVDRLAEKLLQLEQELDK